MGSRIIDIADAVVEAMNAGTFSQAFTAVRAYLPQFDLKEMATLHVTVVPKSVASEMASRSAYQSDYQIDLAVQQRLASADESLLDPFMALVQEIADFWRFRGIRAAGRDFACVKVANDPIYSPEHLAQMQQFTSVLTLTFRCLEDRT